MKQFRRGGWWFRPLFVLGSPHSLLPDHVPEACGPLGPVMRAKRASGAGSRSSPLSRLWLLRARSQAALGCQVSALLPLQRLGFVPQPMLGTVVAAAQSLQTTPRYTWTHPPGLQYRQARTAPERKKKKKSRTMNLGVTIDFCCGSFLAIHLCTSDYTKAQNDLFPLLPFIQEEVPTKSNEDVSVCPATRGL